MKKHFAALMFLLSIVPAFSQECKVVVYRRKQYVGSALKPSIYVDGKQLARLDNGRYVTLQLPPGTHAFESSMKNAAPLEVEVKPSVTSYVEMVILMGTWRGGGRLIPVGEDEGKSAMLRLKPLDSKWIMAAEAAASAPEQPKPGAGSKPEVASANDTSAATPPKNAVPTESPSVTVKSTPEGADIEVDGRYLGSTPSTLQLSPGEHAISIEKPGFKPWQRTMTVMPGGRLTVDATLENQAS